MDVRQAGLKNELAELFGDDDFNALVTFLCDRAVHTPRIGEDAAPGYSAARRCGPSEAQLYFNRMLKLGGPPKEKPAGLRRRVSLCINISRPVLRVRSRLFRL